MLSSAAMARQRVLVDATPLCAASGLRGIGRYVRELLYGLAETREEWQGELELAALFGLEGRDAFRIGEDLRLAADAAFEARGSQRRSLTRARRLDSVAVAQTAGAQLIHYTEPLGMPLLSPVPRLVTCHDLIRLRFPWHYGASFGRRWLQLLREYRNYWLPDRVVAVSEKTKLELLELLGLPSSRIDVIPHGLSLESLKRPSDDDGALLAALGVGARPYLVYVGYSDYRKNVRGMFAALARARRSVDVELVWAGQLPADQKRWIKWRALRAGVSGAVHLTGFVSDQQLGALYRRAVAHLFLSRLEGFGLSAAEAMAAGCPVVVATGSGSDEVVGEAGMRVGPDDTEAAARCIVALASDPDLRERLIRAGFERTALYDRKRMARDYVKSYRRLLGCSSP